MTGCRAWLALGAALAAGAASIALASVAGAPGISAQAFALDSALAWQREHWHEAWRWWTAAWLHLSGLHLAANAAGLALLMALGCAARLPATAALSWALAWPLTHLGLLLAPGLHAYVGLSGVLHAGLACAAVSLLLHPVESGPRDPSSPLRTPPRAAAAALERGRRAVGLAVLVALVAKVLGERPWAGTAGRSVEGWDIPVAVGGHASGLIMGVLTSLLVHAWARALFARRLSRAAASWPAE